MSEQIEPYDEGMLKLSPEQREAEKDKKKSKKVANFIFDPNQVLRKGVFAISKLNDDIFAFGLCLPKEVPLKAKGGDVVGTDQKWCPVLITSNNEFYEPTKEFELEYKTKFNPVPRDIELRWGLPSIEDYLNGREPRIKPNVLFNKIREQYNRFLFFRNELWYDIHGLWDMATYVFRLFNVFPILELRGLAGTAKTKSMKVSRMITLNPTAIMINPSEATLFRETHEKRPTKYFDEAEKLFWYNRKAGKVETDSRAEIINASYTKGGKVPRQEKVRDRFYTVYYDCYSPTQISSIRGLFGATETRAISHIMTKSPDNDPRGEMEVEDYERDPIWQEIRDGCYLFALQNWKRIEKEYRSFKTDANIKKRDLQLWKPLFVLAKIIDKNLFESVKKFAESVSKQRKSDTISENSFDYKILKAVKDIIEQGVNPIYVTRLKTCYTSLFGIEVDKEKGFNRIVSARLDNLGFKEVRGKDYKGSFFEIDMELFKTIILPLCPDLLSETVKNSSESSESSDLNSKPLKKPDDTLTKSDEESSTKPDEPDEVDDSDGSLEVVGEKS